MHGRAFFGWGIVLYALTYLFWSGLLIWGIEGIVARISQLGVVILLSVLAGKMLHKHSWKDVAPYSLVWALTVAGLDLLYVYPFIGMALYSDWNLWLGYTLVFLLPMIAPYIQRDRDVPHI